MNALFMNMISQTVGSTRSVLKQSWRLNLIGVILYVLMAGEPAHLKIVVAPGRLWHCGRTTLSFI